jgi:inhibitor of KinA
LIEPAAFTRLGDRGILVKFNERPSRRLTQHLADFSTAARRVEGVVDAVPGYRTMLLEVDPSRRDDISNHLQTLELEPNARKERLFSLRIRYDGPDVDWVCEHLAIGRDELALRHSRKIYEVRTLGSPAFVYLSSVSRDIAVPRLDDPRVDVPAGSVGIGGRQTGIYARARPGGWRLIGKVLSEVPEVAAGDRVRFKPE